MEEFLIELIAIVSFIIFCWWLLFNKDKHGKYHSRLKNLNEDFFLIQFIKVYGQLIIFAFILVILFFGVSEIFRI